MKAELIFTGTELLTGQILNTHGKYLGQKLSALGIEVILNTTVGDDWERLTAVFKQALERSDIVITTGGLGPTSDDLTKEIICEVLKLPMVLHEESLDSIRQFFITHNDEMPESCMKLAYFPKGAEVIPNPCGTAPGAILKTDNGKIIIILPGPPWELKAMYESTVEGYLSSLPIGGEVMHFTTLKVTGIGEDRVQDFLKDLDGVDNPQISYIAQPGEVHVHITAHAKTIADAKNLIQPLLNAAKERLASYIFAADDEEIEVVVANLLKKNGMNIAVAESCTAGLIQARLCDIVGCSQYLLGGIVCYNKRIKEEIIGIDRKGLDVHGTVSEWTAREMAQNIRKIFKSDLGLAVTGIAGPDTIESKFIGLVYVALATPDGVNCREYHMPGRRMAIRQGSVNAALKMVRNYLERNC
ncbi:competence/damage-inducible protein A [Peptococcaceae bacterium]|nr:competence/damage-inducible protein A [Peptococcaceae bacterium]